MEMKFVCGNCSRNVGCRMLTTFVDCKSKVCRIIRMLNFGCPKFDNVTFVTCDNCINLEIKYLEKKREKHWRKRGKK